MRLFSRRVSSSDSSMSIASSAPISPCSRRRTMASSASRARGIFRPTRSWRIRSSVVGMAPGAHSCAGLPGQATGDRVVERERALGDHVAGAADDERPRLSRRRCARKALAVARRDPALMAALQNGMGADQRRRPRRCGSRRPGCAPRPRAGGWRPARCRSCRRR